MGRNLSFAPTWKIAYASVAGRGHTVSGKPCQDSAAASRKNGVASVMVCDGAGSASRSEVGARAVSTQIAEFMCAHGHEVMCGELGASDILRRARKVVAGLTAAHGGKPRQYACTLVGVVITQKNVASVHLGDGAIAWVSKGNPRLLSRPDNDEFANQTCFVTSSDAEKRLRVTVHPVRGVESIVLMTDGAESTLLDKKTDTVCQVVEQMASWLDRASEEEVSAVLAKTIEEHLIPKTPDDCTVAVIRREGRKGFACAACRRREIARQASTEGRVVLTCAACGHLILQVRGHRCLHSQRRRTSAFPRIWRRG